MIWLTTTATSSIYWATAPPPSPSTTARRSARIAVALARQTRSSLDIVSRHLDPTIYDTEAFAEAAKDIALTNRRARIRLFVIDPRPLITEGHRLLDLCARLSSFFFLRSPAPVHKNFNEAMLIADNTGYIHRQFSDRFDGAASFNDKRMAASLNDRFEEMWERGLPDTNFRRLHI